MVRPLRVSPWAIAVLALSVISCAPTATTRPSPLSTGTIRSGPSPTPTALAVATETRPTPTLPRPTNTPIPRATATPTVGVAQLAPAVTAAAAAFRASIPAGGVLSESQASKAQQALEAAVTAFVRSGALDDPRLIDQFARALSLPDQEPASVLSADLDGDQQRDVIVGVPIKRLEPVIALHGQAATPLLPDPAQLTASAPALTKLVEIRSFAGSSRPFIVLTRATEGASATVTEILIVGWRDNQPRLLFNQSISDWAGTATWRILPDQTVELTCPAFGVYDHKLLPHPRQTRSYRWNGTSFALISRHTDPPTTRREMINLGEADFFAGDFARATTRFRAVIESSSLTDEEGVQVDWPDFARFRLGQIAALSNQQADAERWLESAARAPAPLGSLARAFLDAERTGGPAAGFAAVQHSNVPDLFDHSQMGNLDFPIRLGPLGALGEGVASELNQGFDPAHVQASQLAARLSRSGIQATNVTVADLDGDGSVEVAMIIPFGHREQTLWLFVHEGGRWHAIATVQAPNGLAGIQDAGDQKAIAVLSPPGATPGKTLLFWDGHQVTASANGTSTRALVPTNFVTGDGTCPVAEDTGSP